MLLSSQLIRVEAELRHTQSVAVLKKKPHSKISPSETFLEFMTHGFIQSLSTWGWPQQTEISQVQPNFEDHFNPMYPACE